MKLQRQHNDDDRKLKLCISNILLAEGETEFGVGRGYSTIIPVDLDVTLAKDSAESNMPPTQTREQDGA